jgi:AcrR family transcriptional regulator
MGRPRLHDEQTAAALLDAAERTVAERGVDALSLREVAGEAGTTTRAVYSVFGSKEQLLGALGARAFELLQEGLEELPPTGDARRDVVEAALMFRRFVLDHPALFSIGFQRCDPAVSPRFRKAADDALAVLCQRFTPLADADLLGGRSVDDAALQFDALCEGLAAVELRGTWLALDREQMWRDAVHALVTGFAEAAPRPAARRRARASK